MSRNRRFLPRSASAWQSLKINQLHISWFYNPRHAPLRTLSCKTVPQGRPCAEDQSLTTPTTSAGDYATLSSSFAASLLRVQRMTAFWKYQLHRPAVVDNRRVFVLRFGESRDTCPVCWLFVYFPQALPTDNCENMRRRVHPPMLIHLTGRPAKAAVARGDVTHIVTA